MSADKPTVARRSFVAFASLSAVTGALAACSKNEQSPPKGPLPGAPKEGEIATPPPDKSRDAMPMRKLGSTGVEVSLVGLGGFHIGMPKSDDEAVRIVRSAVDRGVNFLDNCWDYNDGKSEERMGKALEGGYRDKAFLMTKLDGRTKKSAMDQLEQSLKRLRTDRIDLVQVHEVIRPTDPERCFASGGCMEALIEAKQQGKLRFIGFTGHKDPSIHLSMIEAADKHGFRFDTVQMPLNVMDAHYRSFEKMVLPVATAKGMGVLGMKALGSGIILQSNTVSAVDCLHYAMNLPTSVVITGCDSMGVLDQAIQAALTFAPMDAAATTALLDKTRDAAKEGRFERFKTSAMFDGTTRNPHWLETAKL